MSLFSKNENFPCLAIFPVFSLLILLFAYSPVLSASGQGNLIESVATKDLSGKYEVRIKGNNPLISTIYELPNPSRIVVDIADAKLAESIKKDSIINSLITLKTSEIVDAKPTITRLEFYLKSQQNYSSSQEGNEIVLLISADSSNVAGGEAKEPSTKINNLNNIEISVLPDATTVKLLSDYSIKDYTKEILAEKNVNPKLILDINNIKLNEKLQKEYIVNNSSLVKIKIAPRGTGIRLVFESNLTPLFNYKIDSPDKGLELVIDESKNKDTLSSLINQKTNIDSQLPPVNPLEAKLSPQATEKQMQDAFNFSGYNKERITVEFQKMDLHNVFNFLRQVSGVNIVVDESVQGSLTLVLDDVPWDFALDIILNLKELEKEERFNTLVIYPKGKGFLWPKQADNNLSFEADTQVVEQEALLIKQQEKQPLEVVEAKQIMATAREAEKKEDIENAVQLYEQALNKWPDNSKLSYKIATLYLVQLRQNAKALHFSKLSLDKDPNNRSASLTAAIASANMAEKQAAKKYFEQSVNGAKPSKEALHSYAVFNEEQREYANSIKLLEKSEEMYGKELNTMVSIARIFDKMGKSTQAADKYKAILSSGYQVPPDLIKFINDRIAVN